MLKGFFALAFAWLIHSLANPDRLIMHTLSKKVMRQQRPEAPDDMLKCYLTI